MSLYQDLYEAHASTEASDHVIGDGDFDAIGRVELAMLLREGLNPWHTLLDWGCGVGRLAQHAIPYLSRGQYIGTDIAPTMLRRAQERLRAPIYAGARWLHQPDADFPVEVASVDFLCGYSVATHMEPEDVFCYLAAARKVLKCGGRALISCLTLEDDPAARRAFRGAAGQSQAERWSQVRTLATTRSAMEIIAGMAGYQVTRWHGTWDMIPLPDKRAIRLGQAVMVLVGGGGDP